MTQPQGMLTLDELRSQVEAGAIETVIVAFTDLYGRLVGKRFDAPFFLEEVASHGTHACNYLLTVDMEMEPVPGYEFSNWEGGYGDFHLAPDHDTLRIAAWLDRTALVICDVEAEVDGDASVAVAQAPRSILTRQIERASAMGFSAMAGSELEYYLFRTSYRDAAKAGYAQSGMESAGWYLEDYHTLQATREEPFNAVVRKALRESGVPVECTKGEWGLGQHELNVRYAEVLQMADRHSIYKQCLKEVADQQEISVTFMAKYAADQAGSSSHIHVSLWNAHGNVFAGESEFAGIKCSNEFRWFLAGWMEHVEELMAFYAPTVNSYKRYQSGSWAPTRIAWSRDNRTAGFRVVGHGPSLRIECRIPGADCNPYLAYAAALAAGLDGIERQLEPMPEFCGDVYVADSVPEVPMSLSAATQRFAESDFVRKTFGDEVVDHYAHFFRTEQAAYDQAVTDWERKRYFERI